MNNACENFNKSRGIYDVNCKMNLELPLEKEFIESCYNHDKQV